MKMTNTSKAAAMIAAARKAHNAKVVASRDAFDAEVAAARAAYDGACADAGNRLFAVYAAARLLAAKPDEV